MSTNTCTQGTQIKKAYSVLIIDMAHYMDDDSKTTIDGFPSFEMAKEFARRRVRDSLEELRKQNQNKEELQKSWLIYGEDAIVFDGEKKYEGKSEVDFFIAHPAVPEERDWKSIMQQAGILKL